ncbi:MAG: glycosyltransferase family 4 protein [Steroidobacteraceae bacterium]
MPSGIDSFIRGILKWAPEDLRYTLIGGSSNLQARPLGEKLAIPGILGDGHFLPVVEVDASGRQSRIPLTLRYMRALQRLRRDSSFAHFDALDFHRPEPVLLFYRDKRPKNLVLHQDMTVIRSGSSDIRWRHWPWLYERFESVVFRQVDHVFCVRQSAIDRYRSEYPGSEEKFEFIPTWVDNETFASCPNPDARDELRRRIRAELELPVDAALLTFVGRLDRQKDPVLLLEAFWLARALDPALHLVIVGDGVLRPEVEDRIAASPDVAHVSLLGALPPRSIAELLRASDLFVLSSAYEGMPIAVLEALATGLPVVSTDVGEIRRVVKEGINGTISGTRTPAGLAQAIASAMQQCERLRGLACSDSVREYGPEAVLGLVYDQHRKQASRWAQQT